MGNLYRAMGHFPLILLMRFTLIFFLNRLSCKTQTLPTYSDRRRRVSFLAVCLPLTVEFYRSTTIWCRCVGKATVWTSPRFRPSVFDSLSENNGRRSINRTINSEHVRAFHMRPHTYGRREHGIRRIKRVDLNDNSKYDVCLKRTRSTRRIVFLLNR